jgi:hypothetical protein
MTVFVNSLLLPKRRSSFKSCSKNHSPLHRLSMVPGTNMGQSLRLAYWNADGVRGGKLELDLFHSLLGVGVCLLNERHLESDRIIRVGNYFCHRTDRPTQGEGTEILVRGVTDIMLCQPRVCSTWRPLHYTSCWQTDRKVLAAYLSPARPVIVSDWTDCLSGGLPVLM